MRSLLFLLPLLVVVRSEGNVCADVRKEFNECHNQAHQTYYTAVKLGDDGRPNWSARKACNYLTEAMEVCGNKLMQHDCNSEEAVTQMKDQQLSQALRNLKSSIADWDSCKCPPVKAHIDRMKAKEGLDVEEECPPEFAVIHAVQSTSEFIDLDFGFIGGVIVATGIVLAKSFF